MSPAGPLVFAGKSVLAPVIKEIITKAFRYLDGYFSAETMEEMKTKLEAGVVQIESVLAVVSPDHIESEKIEPLDQWFWKLRDAVEEAEDAIDELEYYELEEKAKDHQVSDWGSPFTKAKHKVIRSVKYVGVLDKTVKRFTHRGTLKRLKKAVDGLDKTIAGATNFLEVVKYLKGASSSGLGREDFMNNNRQTGSTSTVTKFVGREKEKKQILEWLSKKTIAEEEADIVPIFSLIGHGGMGKTTLAQQICKHGEVLKDFKVIWVTVSTSFDATSVTKKILESVIRETPKADSLEPLQQALKDKLKCADKFFLVLDDVWEEEKRNEWEKLFAPLRTMKGGSKILLTTRMASVATTAASVMGVAGEDLALKELRADENLELFNHHVFFGLYSQDYGEFKVIGEQIARKLNGCPLVTKVVSGHLQGNMTFEFWNRFLCEDYLNDFKGNTGDIMKVLRLSYYYLPTELQSCFRYCSIFPQDYRFEKKELLLMWIGSGLISIRDNDAKSLEETAEDYLFQLSRKSFFEKEINEGNFNCHEEEYYGMHDLLHELAEYVSSGECKRINSPAQLEDAMNTVRHLNIKNINGQNVDHFKIIQHFQHLRTLIISTGERENVIKNMACAISNALGNLRSLRLIQINCSFPLRFLEKACKLKHLRAIFSNALALEDMHQISKLYHLMVLLVRHMILFHRYNLDAEWARNMVNLDRLRYLSYDAVGEFPVSKLTSLQELKRYEIRGCNKISDVGNLKFLRELQVLGLENVDNVDEARNAKLKEKKYLISLTLCWSASSSEAQKGIDDLVLDQLEPHAGVRELTIYGYEGRRPPFWMDNGNIAVKFLVSLELEGCINWEQIPWLGELVLLRHLTFKRLPNLQQIGGSSHMSTSCSSMELYLPPNLCSLRVEQCQELRELPILPTSLECLDLIDVGLTNLPRIGKLHSENFEGQQSCLIDITVENCPRLVSLEGSLLEQKQYMGGLQSLNIRRCTRLELVLLLPFKGMSKLSKLEIIDCPKMRILGDEGDMILPQSISYLSISQCGNLEPPLLWSLQCPSNLSELKLEYCSRLVSLPSADVCSKNLKSLRLLQIRGCDNLLSLGGLGSLPSLSCLIINKCCKLVEVARSSQTGDASSGEEHLVVSQLEHLIIDVSSLLLVQPLKSLRHLSELDIGFGDASETEGLSKQLLSQNFTSLKCLRICKPQSLPVSMRHMSTLKGFYLYDAGKLQSLPDLPLSLTFLSVSACHPDLEKKIRGYECPEWDKIFHVRRAMIGERHFIFGKQCSLATIFELSGADDNTLACWANQQDNGKGVESAPVQSALTRWRNLCRLGGAS